MFLDHMAGGDYQRHWRNPLVPGLTSEEWRAWMSGETDILGASQAFKQLHSDMGASLRRLSILLMCLVPFWCRQNSSQGSSHRFLLNQKRCTPIPRAFLPQPTPLDTHTCIVTHACMQAPSPPPKGGQRERSRNVLGFPEHSVMKKKTQQKWSC